MSFGVTARSVEVTGGGWSGPGGVSFFSGRPKLRSAFALGAATGATSPAPAGVTVVAGGELQPTRKAMSTTPRMPEELASAVPLSDGSAVPRAGEFDAESRQR